MNNTQLKRTISSQEFAAGFTMVEMVLVTVIIGIAALTALPMLNGVLEHSKLKGATEEVVNALQYAQVSAMKSGRQTRVVIASSTDKIGVRQFEIIADLINGGDELVAADVEGGSYEFMEYPLKKGTDYDIKFNDEDRFRGVDITESNFSVGNGVYFDSLGSPSHGGKVALVLGDYRMTVEVDGLTGKVTVSE